MSTPLLVKAGRLIVSLSNGRLQALNSLPNV